MTLRRKTGSKQPREADGDQGFVRRPGLFRAWEIAHLLTLDVVFRIEAAGRTADGCDLFFVFECVEPKPLEA